MLDINAVNERISEVIYKVSEIPGQGPRHTTCTIVTVGGSIVTGESCCHEEEDFDPDVGREAAYNKAFGRLCELEAYHQRQVAFDSTGMISKVVRRFKGEK